MLKYIEQFIKSNYHKELNLSEEEFIKSIPEPKIKTSKDFNKILLVIPMIDLKKQLELTNIKLNVNINKININNTHTKPYWIIFQDGSKNRGKSPNFCLDNLNNNEKGLNIIEGISMYLQYPEVVDDHSVDLIGSKYGNECNTTIYKWNDKVMISAICSDISDSMCGSATCLI